VSDLAHWIARQTSSSIAGLLRSISPDIVKTREGFGQVIVPKKGSVVASPVLASYDPDPDYFFHWYRDSALVMDALRLVQDSVPGARRHFDDFVRFSLDLMKLDGRAMPADWRSGAGPEFRKFLRKDMEAAHGGAILSETRVNPDGTLDITDWPRPQHDGPALRALTVLRWGAQSADAIALLRADLDFVLRHARKPCFDIWEEELGLHYYVLCVCEAALREGGLWLAQHDADQASVFRAEAAVLAQMLEDYWLAPDGFVRSRVVAKGRSAKELDIAVILAANHAGAPQSAQLTATLDKLAAMFNSAYAINRNRPGAPAMGRYAGDSYYAGGAYYFSTLGAAEFCYRSGALARGDAFLETVRRFAPEDGTLPEQFDQGTGAPASARDLAWSHAAFLSCISSRQEILAAG
jgi:glucoamylase